MSRTARRIRSSRALASALVLVVAGAAGLARAEGSPDGWITTKVKMALILAEDVSATDVRADTIDGMVTLHGTVQSAEESARAERAARAVSGVRELRNLLQVVDTPRRGAAAIADEAVASEVARRLGADPALRDGEIRVESVNLGVVLLGGDAYTLSDHLHALEVARRTPGVKRVASEIVSPDALGDDEIWRDAEAAPDPTVSPTARDRWITTAAKVRLIANEATPARDINVDTAGRAVTLFGTVPSEAARRAAEREVRKVDGVKSVENDLQVVLPDSSAAVEQRDDRVSQAIAERLKQSDELSDASIEVAVANGVARLTGSVDSQADRLTALTLARTTEGVRSVVGDLAIDSR